MKESSRASFDQRRSARRRRRNRQRRNSSDGGSGVDLRSVLFIIVSIGPILNVVFYRTPTPTPLRGRFKVDINSCRFVRKNLLVEIRLKNTSFIRIINIILAVPR